VTFKQYIRLMLPELDDTDVEILLKHDIGLTQVEIAVLVKLTQPTICRRLQKIEKLWIGTHKNGL
jgi:DNA-binding Lrp family transcriptional regulator